MALIKQTDIKIDNVLYVMNNFEIITMQGDILIVGNRQDQTGNSCLLRININADNETLSSAEIVVDNLPAVGTDGGWEGNILCKGSETIAYVLAANNLYKIVKTGSNYTSSLVYTNNNGLISWIQTSMAAENNLVAIVSYAHINFGTGRVLFVDTNTGVSNYVDLGACQVYLGFGFASIKFWNNRLWVMACSSAVFYIKIPLSGNVLDINFVDIIDVRVWTNYKGNQPTLQLGNPFGNSDIWATYTNYDYGDTHIIRIYNDATVHKDYYDFETYQFVGDSVDLFAMSMLGVHAAGGGSTYISLSDTECIAISSTHGAYGPSKRRIYKLIKHEALKQIEVRMMYENDQMSLLHGITSVNNNIYLIYGVGGYQGSNSALYRFDPRVPPYIEMLSDSGIFDIGESVAVSGTCIFDPTNNGQYFTSAVLLRGYDVIQSFGDIYRNSPNLVSNSFNITSADTNTDFTFRAEIAWQQ